VDRLCDRIATARLTEEERSNLRYPPEQLIAFVDMFRVGDTGTVADKHRIVRLRACCPTRALADGSQVMYLLLDIGQAGRGAELVNSFARTFRMPMAEQRLVYGLWLLDEPGQSEARPVCLIVCVCVCRRAG
jgi:hypothetical protein